MELISIIVPIYKVEAYLKKCVESILNQTYKNLEIILVDDGSPDGCGKICDEYAQKDNRIKVIHKENGGLSSARNAGLEIATGEYISFIDSDDYVAENFIEKLYNLAVENNADISECNFLKFENDVVLKNENESVELYTSYDMLKRMYNTHATRTIVVWNKLYKKKIYDNLRFPVGKINEDEFITYKAFYNSNNLIATTNLSLYYYRYSPQSIMGRKFNAKRLDLLDALEERKQFYKEKNEKELFEMTVEVLQKYLKEFYFLSLENIEEPKECLRKIKGIMRRNLIDYVSLKKVKLFSKIKMFLFSLLPSLYIFLIKIKREAERT